MESLLDIIIVNWNSGGHLRTCLSSLPQALSDAYKPRCRVVIVDNASTDGSADALPPLALPVHTIRNNSNRGYAAACNQGAGEGSATYLLFLNPDSQLLNRAISTPLDVLTQPHHASIGICGIQILDAQHRIRRTCMRTPSLRRMVGLQYLLRSPKFAYHMRTWSHTHSQNVDCVQGSFFLVRRAVFESLGGFDERFFVYFEEVDFCARASKVGWQTRYVAEATMIHFGGTPWWKLDAWRTYQSARSRIVYYFKHFNVIAGFLLSVHIFVIEPPIRLVMNLFANGADERAGLNGYVRLWTKLLYLLKTRRLKPVVNLLRGNWIEGSCPEKSPPRNLA